MVGKLGHYRLGLKIAVAAATIGLIYGYDLGNISGALLFLIKRFDLTTTETEWVTSIVVAGSIVGALVASRLANAIGRKPTMVLVAVTYAAFAILSAAAPSLVWLDAARFCLGVTIGISIVTAPIFVAESSPAAIRGGLIVMYQVATVTGIVVAYFVDYALAGGGNWRLMLGLSAVPALLVVAVLARLPDTARWYVMKGRRSEARETLRVADPDADVDRELDEIEDDLRRERGGSIGEMLRRPYLRATLFVVGLGFLIQITGINAVVFYSPLIFKQMGFSGNAALLLLPALVQVGSLIATVVSLSVVDRLGRRPTLLTGIGAMIASTLLMVIFFAAGDLSGAVGFVGILVFTAGFNFGFGSLVWVYASESFPARLRTAGASAMLTADLIANLVIALYFLSAMKTLGGTATFAIFAGLAAVAWLFIWWLAPETKGRPLEAIRGYWENGGRWPEPAADGREPSRFVREPGGTPARRR
ncbi:MAG TPA: sugar porter family MFS transporter [Solirubrobacteraceae bacterium]